MMGCNIAIFNLLIQCPFGDEKGDCPAIKLRRSLNLEQKFAYARGLSASDAQVILQYHDQCFANRLQWGE